MRRPCTIDGRLISAFFRLRPMHRHSALQPLSREHHFALRYAKRLKQLADAEPRSLVQRWPDIRLRFARYWSEALAPHFVAEEDVLPWRYLDAGWRDRLEDDHRHIGALFRHLMATACVDTEALASLGRRLGEHARWEEQQLFVAFQAHAPSAALRQVQRALAGTDDVPVDLGWLPPNPGGY